MTDGHPTEDTLERILTVVLDLSEQVGQLREEKSDRQDIQALQGTLDRILGLLDSDELERRSMNVQLDRHEDWIVRAAKPTGVRYSHGQ